MSLVYTASGIEYNGVHVQELKQDIKRDSRKGKDTAAPSQMQKSSSIGSADSQALSPRARSAAKAVQAAACKVVITPGGPLPVPAGAAWSDSISATNNLSLSYGTPAQVLAVQTHPPSCHSMLIEKALTFAVAPPRAAE